MNEELKHIKELMQDKNATLVISYKNQEEIFFDRGVKPLLMMLGRKIDYSHYLASDKVIGKAAALLYINLGIKNIYCELISEKALRVFKKYNINIFYDKIVPLIQNRDKTGYCPMESLVLNIDDPKIALEVIKDKIKQMNN